MQSCGQRQGDPEHDLSHLPFAEVLGRLEAGGDDAGGRENDEAGPGQRQHHQQQIAFEQDAQGQPAKAG